MSPTIEIRFSLSREDVVSTVRWLTWRRSRVSLVIVGFLVFLLAAGILATHLRSEKPGQAAWSILFVAAFVAALLYAFFMAPARAYRRLPATFREGEQFWKFSEEGVESRGPTAEAKYLWSTWVDFAETRDCFLLFPQKHQAHMIPKRAFASPEDVGRFRDLARNRIAPG